MSEQTPESTPDSTNVNVKADEVTVNTGSQDAPAESTDAESTDSKSDDSK